MPVSAKGISLVADAGGTNTRVALASGGQILPGSIRRYRNAGLPSLEDILRRYLTETGNPGLDDACVAVAGPVRGGCARLTNLDWEIEESTLAQAVGAGCARVINDLQAQGFALGRIAAADIAPVIRAVQAPPEDRPARLVVGIGTGFNAALVAETGAGRIVTASECGHMRLPVHDSTAWELSQWLSARDGFPALEDALSGRGLEAIYRFLGETGGRCSDPLSSADILASARQGSDPQAVKAADLFARLLGSACGDLSLVHLPFGGIYLSGGVARAVTELLPEPGFAEAFRDKGRFSDFMGNFPVSVIGDDFAALSGCAACLVLPPEKAACAG